MINKIGLLKEIGIEFDSEMKKKLNIWQEAFVQYNVHTNLMSKGDIEFLFEKHVFDSCAINLWDGFKNVNKILDVGTGGGFPSVILAIFFPEKIIFANDSRIKKINFIREIKNKLSLQNLEIVYSRIEDAEPFNVDLITSRAVGKMIDVYELSKKHLKKKGEFLFYKSKTVEDEINCFKKKYKNTSFNVIPYKLPLAENFERKLVIAFPQ